MSFPIVLSNGPPPAGTAPSGRNALAEVAAAGVTMLRTGRADWSAGQADAQLAQEHTVLDALGRHGLESWLWLGDVPNLPAGTTSPQARLLTKLVDGLQGHSALGAYKGVDEPRNPFRGANWIRPDGLVRAYQLLHRVDAAHPVVITQAPIGTVAQLRPYLRAFDITGADAYPVSYPPGTHTDTDNKDISVVGDVTKKMVQAAGAKPVWMTLQIAWSGIAPTKDDPSRVPRFPSLPQLRFMAYQAIVNGARGLVFFGGHLTQVTTPADAAAGWNWTFWEQTLGPLVRELSADVLSPALAAAATPVPVKASVAGVELAVRRAGSRLFVIAVRRSGSVSRVRFTGLPAAARNGRVLFEYVQQPPPPPIEAGHQGFREVDVAKGAFSDWFAQHDVHVYRFDL